jgi:hypothetical protein
MSECKSARSHGVMWIDEVWGSFCPICKCSEQSAEIANLKMLARRVLSCPMPPEINALTKALEDS